MIPAVDFPLFISQSGEYTNNLLNILISLCSLLCRLHFTMNKVNPKQSIRLKQISRLISR